MIVAKKSGKAHMAFLPNLQISLSPIDNLKFPDTYR